MKQLSCQVQATMLPNAANGVSADAESARDLQPADARLLTPAESVVQ